MTRGGQESLFPWDNEPKSQAEPPPPGTGAPPRADPPGAPQPRPPVHRKSHAAETDAPAAADATRRAERPLVKKEYYSISEVADLVGLPAHVLRYWETQFSVLNPSKNRSGNRAYQRKEIRLILLVKQLLYDEKYTVEGAKQKLEQLRRGGTLGDTTARALDAQLVRVLRDDLKAVLRILSPDPE